MKGVVMLGGREAEVRDFPVPRPGPNEVLIRMKRSAVCGSDLRLYRKPLSYFEGMPTLVMGHEPAGVVEELGSQAHRLKIGARVCLCPHHFGCGHCPQCLAGYPQYCSVDHRVPVRPDSGASADYMVADERNCMILPDELTFEDGALISCIASTAYAAVRRLRPTGDDTLVVFGLGPVGLMGTIMAKAMGARVIGVELVDERRQLCRRLGADEVLDPRSTDVVDAIRDLTHGTGAQMALETSASSAAQQAVIETLRPEGHAVFLGISDEPSTLALGNLIRRGLTITGSLVTPLHYYWDLVEFILRHDLQPKFHRLITHRFKLVDAAEAFRVADSCKAGKIVFIWD